MKQNITVDDFNELSLDERVKFIKLFKRKEDPDYESYVNYYCSTRERDEEHFIKISNVLTSYITVGKLIEILEVEYDVDITTVRKNMIKDKIGVKIYNVECDEIGFINNTITYKSQELCDALWQAVKEIL